MRGLLETVDVGRHAHELSIVCTIIGEVGEGYGRRSLAEDEGWSLVGVVGNGSANADGRTRCADGSIPLTEQGGEAVTVNDSVSPANHRFPAAPGRPGKTDA